MTPQDTVDIIGYLIQGFAPSIISVGFIYWSILYIRRWIGQ